MTNPLNGLIEINITSEHIAALQAVHNEYRRIDRLQNETETKQYFFGLFERKVPKHTNITTNCPMLGFWQSYEYDISAITTKHKFTVLNETIRNCKGQKIYLSLDNYDTLCELMHWYKLNKDTFSLEELL
jgi:hypothetical protein